MKTFYSATILLLAVLMINGACSLKNKDGFSLISLTAREDTAINTILNEFSGECFNSVGMSTEIKGSHKFFEIQLSKSPFIEKYAERPQIVASGVAYLFYKGLAEEKNNYGEIRIVILTADQVKHTFTFTPEQLELVDHKFAVADTIIAMISGRQWDKVEDRLQNSPALPIPVKDLMKNIMTAEEQLGSVTSRRHFGFEFGNMDQAGTVLHLYCILRREKQGTEFRVDINTPPNDNLVYMINYNF